MKPKSNGFKRDLLVAMFCGSLINVAQSEFEDDEVIIVDVGDALETTLQNIASDIQNVLKSSSLEVQRWIKRKTETAVPQVLSNINTKTVSLETLSLYILFVNFIERRYPLDEELKFLVSKYDYMELAENLNKTRLGDIEAEMFNLAYEVLQNLR